MKFSIELATHFGEILPPEEMKVHFKQDDNGVETWIHDIRVHKHCPMCGHFDDIRFDSVVWRNDDNHTPYHWLKTTHECDKCHKLFGVAAKIIKEEDK